MNIHIYWINRGINIMFKYNQFQIFLIEMHYMVLSNIQEVV
jgi:hypothetical protein